MHRPPFLRLSLALVAACADGPLADPAPGALVLPTSEGPSLRLDAHGARLDDGSGVVLARMGRAEPVALPEPTLRTGHCAATAARALGCGRRVEQVQGPVTTWWAQHPRGLWQGFEIATRPTGNGPLRLDLALHDVTDLAVGPGGATFNDEHGTTWQVDTLAAWDADGRALAVAIEPTGDGLALHVDDQGARYPLLVDPVYSTVVIALDGAYDGHVLGWALAAADLDGDGDDELIVGGNTQVQVHAGGTGGPSSTATTTLTGATNTGFGLGLGAGDLDDDGYDDLFVGAPDDSSGRGTVFAYHGSAAGIPTTATRSTTGQASGDRFGSTIAAGADFDGDGFGDLAIGAPSRDHPATDAGRVYVYKGSASGWSYLRALDATSAGDAFGSALGLGDVTEDGYADVIVGAPQYGATDKGAVHVFDGSSTGPASAHSRVMVGAYDGDELGSAVAPVNFSQSDVVIAVGAPFYEGTFGADTGAIFFYWGGTTTNSGDIYRADDNDLSIGTSVARVPDMDGDGDDELIAGVPLNSGTRGTAFLYEGSPGMSEDRTSLGDGEALGERAGQEVVGGDFDGDGFGDVAWSAPSASGVGFLRGKVWVKRGYRDVDNDGWSSITDCDDNDRTITTYTWYRDSDGDGYGLSTGSTQACTQPSGYVANSTDCDDTNAARDPGNPEVCDAVNLDEDCDGLADDADTAATGKTTYPRDADGDGFGSSTVTGSFCDQPAGYVTNTWDCNDNSAVIGTPYTYYRDADGDGYGLASSTTSSCASTLAGYTRLNSTDCNDTTSTVNPGASEVCDSSDVDEDCDGLSDNADGSASGATKTTWYIDLDDDGYGGKSSLPTYGTTQACDAFGNYTATVATDCADFVPSYHPGATEVCDNSNTDEDCDNTADDSDTSVLASTKTTWWYDFDQDGFGRPDASQALTRCDSPSSFYVANDDDCDDDSRLTYPGATEFCDDLDIDQDCDGLADDDDPSVSLAFKTFYRDLDGDGYGITDVAIERCDLVSGYAREDGDCDPDDAQAYPGAPETCDGEDDDCDGGVDEGFDDIDADGVCDAIDGCPNDPDDDADGDGVCGDADVCVGDDASGDSDGDGTCDDQDFVLTAGPIVPGGLWAASISGAPAGATVYLLVSVKGVGGSTCFVSGRLCPELKSPLLVGTVRANAEGTGSTTVKVPATARAGVDVWVRGGAVVGTTGHLTNLVHTETVAAAAQLSPAEPGTDDDLHLTVTATTGSTVGGPYWLVDGVNVPALRGAYDVSALATTAGETWTARVSLRKGGKTVQTEASVTIGNAGPRMEAVEVVTDSTVPCAALRCAATVTDADGTTPAVTYAWTIDGVLVAGADDDTLDDVALTGAEAVACAAQADDGVETSAWVGSAVINPPATVADADADGVCDAAEPCAGDVGIPTVARADGELTCAWSELVEGCALEGEVQITWTADGVEVGTGATIDAGTVPGGAVLACAVSVSSGATPGTPVASNETLLGPGAWTLTGEAAGDWAGISVAVVGDLDGDGLPELAVGAPNAAPGGATSAGRVYGLMGSLAGADVALGDVGEEVDGWTWEGATGGWSAYDTICQSWYAVYSGVDCTPSAAGRTTDGAYGAPLGDGFGTRLLGGADVDGDDVPDLVVTAPYALAGGGYLTGQVYMVSGALAVAASSEEVLAGSVGFTVVGPAGVTASKVIDGSGYHPTYDGELGGFTAALLDEDGDGLADLALSAPNADPHGDTEGRVYVVHGSDTPSSLALSAYGREGFGDAGAFAIEAPDAPSDGVDQRLGTVLAWAGDLDGDGDDELVASSDHALAHEGFVVRGGGRADVALALDVADTSAYGSYGGEVLDISFQQGSGWIFRGTSIEGAHAAGVGDVDGDGWDDLAVPYAELDAAGPSLRLVVYPGGDVVDWAPDDGLAEGAAMVVRSELADGLLGDFVVYPAGDVDGDGHDDVALTTAITSEDEGRLYVILGGSGVERTVDDLAAGVGGTLITVPGVTRIDAVAHGDLDGDGLSDLVYGAAEAAGGAGQVSIWYGRDLAGSITQSGTAGDDVLTGTSSADALVAGYGDDVLHGGDGDALSAGAGDDLIVLDGTDVVRVDGGLGWDQLTLTGGAALDLSGLRRRVRGMEQLALGSSSLSVAAQDLVRLSPVSNLLVVTGGSGASVVATADAWEASGSWSLGETTGTAYTSGRATLVVEDGVATSMAPWLATTELSIPENPNEGDLVGTLEVVDPDGEGVEVTLDPAGMVPGMFFWVPGEQAVRVADASGFDHEATPSVSLTVRLTDEDGLTRDVVVDVAIGDENETPSFPLDDAGLTVVEGAPDGSLIGAIGATDPDAGDVLGWAVIGGDDDGSFDLDTTSGVLRVGDGSLLDFESDPHKVLEIAIYDAGGLWTSRWVDIEVADATSVTTSGLLAFVTEDQCKRQQGAAPCESEASGTVDQSIPWDVDLTGGDVAIWSTLGDVASLQVQTSGTIDVYADVDIEDGLLSAWLPIELDVTWPDDISEGDTVTVDLGWALRDDATIWGELPRVVADVDIDLWDAALTLGFGDQTRNFGPTDLQVVYDTYDVGGDMFTGKKVSLVWPDGVPAASTTSSWFSDLYVDFGEATWLDFQDADYAGQTWDDLWSDADHNARTVMSSATSVELFRVTNDPSDFITDQLGAAWEGGAFQAELELTTGKVAVEVELSQSWWELALGATDISWVTVDAVRGDLVLEDGTTFPDVDASEALAGVTIPLGADADGDGLVTWAMVLDVEATLFSYTSYRRKLDWWARYVYVEASTWAYSFDLSGDVTGSTLVRRDTNGPWYEGVWQFPAEQDEVRAWPLGGFGTVTVEGAIQLAP